MPGRMHLQGAVSSRPKSRRAAWLGIPLVGMIVGLLIIFNTEHSDTRMVELHEVEAALLRARRREANLAARSTVDWRGLKVVDVNHLVAQWSAADIAKLMTMHEKTTWKVFQKSVKEWPKDDLLPEGGIFIRAGDLPQMWIRDSTASFHHFLARDSIPPRFLAGGQNSDFFPQFTYLLVEMMIKDVRCPTWNYENWECPTFIPFFGYEADSPLYALRFLRYLHKHESLWGLLSDRAKLRIPLAVKAIVNNLQKDVDSTFQKTGVSMVPTVSRSSDHDVIYPYNIPNHLFAVAELIHLNAMPYKSPETASQAGTLAYRLQKAADEHAVDDGVYCYEANFSDGSRIACLKLDDANLPSLLSIPYLADGTPYNEKIYSNTRKYILSPQNEFYFSGRHGGGIGSNHFTENRIWHMALIAQALTSNDEQEVQKLLKMLMATDAGTNLMHESFRSDNPADFTRAWFDWPNALFSELVMRSCKDFASERNYTEPFPTSRAYALSGVVWLYFFLLTSYLLQFCE